MIEPSSSSFQWSVLRVIKQQETKRRRRRRRRRRSTRKKRAPAVE